jgi:hypothetical protein
MKVVLAAPVLILTLATAPSLRAQQPAPVFSPAPPAAPASTATPAPVPGPSPAPVTAPQPSPVPAPAITAPVAPAPVTLAVSAPAEAPTFGRRGQVVVATERLFGYAHTSATTSDGGIGGSSSTTTDTFALVTNPLSGVSAYSAPRLAVDWFVADRISLGGSVGIFGASQSREGSSSSATVRGVLLAPRVGLSALIAPNAAIWGRAGFTALSIWDDSTSANAFAVSIDAPLVFTIFSHVAILMIPNVDFGISGSTQVSGGASGDRTVDRKITEFGLQFGLAGYL